MKGISLSEIRQISVLNRLIDLTPVINLKKICYWH